MKKEVMIFFILLMMLSFPANAQWYFDSNEVTANIRITSDTEILPLAASHKVEYVGVNMTFFPKAYPNQEIIYFETEPDAELLGESLKFRIEEPDEKNLAFTLNADIKSTNSIIKVKGKIKFPVSGIPEGLAAYTKPSKTIDSDNPDIIRMASRIAGGEDDLYSVVYKIGDWTKSNINYNLSTLNAKTSQTAGWVLQNRQGVCDELTALFIAMLRSLGIPAKFISGLAYTNSPLFDEGWGSHGWAEVYFPGYGWIPYDVTYGQFGFVDPTHFKFKESIDPDEGSTFYEWRGSNVNLFTKPLDIKTRLIKHEGYASPVLNLKTSAAKGSVGFGSYNLIEAEISNPNDFYYATEVFLSKPDEVGITGAKGVSVLLLPKSSKKVFWIMSVNENLNDNFLYTMPVAVSTYNNLTSTVSFKAGSKEISYSLSDIEKLAGQKEEESQKKESASLQFACNAEKSQFYIGENNSVICRMKNLGNVYIGDLSVCYSDRCITEQLGISQEKEVLFDLKEGDVGKHEASVIARNSQISKAEFITFELLDIPKIEIKDVNIPSNATYGGSVAFSIRLAKKSFSDPLNLSMKFWQNGIAREFRLARLVHDKDFEFTIDGERLKSGSNMFVAEVLYKDGNGNIYEEKKEYLIELVGLTFGQKTKVFFYQFGLKIAYLDIKTLVIMFIVASIAFILTLLYTFRPDKEEEGMIEDEIKAGHPKPRHIYTVDGADDAAGDEVGEGVDEGKIGAGKIGK